MNCIFDLFSGFAAAPPAYAWFGHQNCQPHYFGTANAYRRQTAVMISTVRFKNVLFLQSVWNVSKKNSIHRYLWMLKTMAMISVAAWGVLYWYNHAYRWVWVVYNAIEHFQIPYFAYIFAKVSKDHFSSVSSFTHAAVFAGNFIGAVSNKLFFDRTISSQIIFYLIFTAQIIATVITACLPKLDRMQSPVNVCNHFVWIFEQLKFAYTNYRISVWSLWFIGGTTILKLETTLLGPNQFHANLQSPIFYAGEFLGIFLALLACYVFMRTKRHALMVLIVASLASGGLMFLAANASSPSIFYVQGLLNIIHKVTITMSR